MKLTRKQMCKHVEKDPERTELNSIFFGSFCTLFRIKRFSSVMILIAQLSLKISFSNREFMHDFGIFYAIFVSKEASFQNLAKNKGEK